MKLVSLALANFKGQRSLTVEPNGGDLSVFGDNATGKTTLFDAYSWLLFGKDSQNRADFEIKTIDPKTGECVHNLDHSVEAEFVLDGGKHVSFRRSYAEQWVKKRGSAQSEQNGHTSDYKINGVPVQKREFDDRIAALCDEKKFRLLSDPSYFNVHLPWNERRRILLDVCGDVSDEDVIASDPSLARLSDLTKDHSLDDLRKILKARLTELRKEIEHLPVKIQAANRTLGDDVGEPVPTLPLQNAVDEALEAKAAVTNGGAAAGLSVKIQEAKAALQARETELKSGGSGALDEALKLVRECQAKVSQLEADVHAFEVQVESHEANATRLETEIESLRAEYREESKREFFWGGDEVCATCGQDLPAGQVEEAKAKALSDFNTRRANLLAENQAAGKSKAETLRLEREAAESKRSKLALMRSDIEQSRGDLENLRVSALDEAQAKVDAARAELQKAQEHNAAVKSRKETLRQIAEYEEQEKRFAEQHEQASLDLDLTDRFVRAKVAMLTERINGRFGYVRFKLFDVQVNGGVNECCECTVDSVPFGSLNGAARINAGLDVIDTLSRHYGFAPPVWIDNAESVTDLRPTLGQQIRLVVSAADPSMRFVSDSAPTAQSEQGVLIN